MMMMSVTTECAIPASNTNGFQTLKGEHQVRYDDGITPDQTITDGAEPNSKLTARPMSALPPKADIGCDRGNVRWVRNGPTRPSPLGHPAEFSIRGQMSKRFSGRFRRTKEKS